MTDHARPATNGPETHDLERRLAELTAVVVDQARRLADLEQRPAPAGDLAARSTLEPASPAGRAAVLGTTSTVPDPTPPGDEPSLDRRRLLRLGTVAAGAAAGVVVTGGLAAEPASAANGGNLIIGQTNTATAVTLLQHTSGSPISNANILQVGDSNSTGSGNPAAIGGYAAGTSVAVGVYGRSAAASGTGLVGRAVGASSTGLFASGTQHGAIGTTANAVGYGVQGTNTAGIGEGAGVMGTSSSSVGSGVFAENTGSGTGLTARCGSTGTAVFAIGSDSSFGVAAHVDTNGTAVFAKAIDAGGTGVEAIADLGVHVLAQVANLHLESYEPAPPPPARGGGYAAKAGYVVIDDNHDLWLCTADGAPGKWTKLGGATTAGSFHVLPSTIRVYDSRAGSPPAVGAKGQLTNGAQRVVDGKYGGAIPAGATAALVNLTVTNTSAAGFVALFKNGITWPGNSSINWDHANQTIANLAVVALDASASMAAKANVNCACDFLIDVIGYYR